MSYTNINRNMPLERSWVWGEGAGALGQRNPTGGCVFFMNVSKGREKTYLQKKPLTFNLTGCIPTFTLWSTQLTLAHIVACVICPKY